MIRFVEAFSKGENFKNSKIFFIYILSSLSFFIYSIHSSGSYRKQIPDQAAELRYILKKCANYCERLDSSALFFVCKERIKEVRYHPTLGTTNVYVYDYQLIRKDKRIIEKRILIEENGLKKNDKNAQLKTKLFYYKNIIFGPYGSLSELWQEHYDFKIIGEENYKGKEAMVIEALPISAQVSNDLYGKIWLAEADSSILKIEWNQKSIENFEVIEATAKALGATPQITLIAEYDLEKNGIRFPTEFSILEAYIAPKSLKRILKSKTTVTYTDYRFFTVETEVKH